MRALIARVPLPVLLSATMAASMAVPAIHAISRGADREARAFSYSCLLLLALVAAIALAASRDAARRGARGHLVALLSAYTLLPALAAVPLVQALGATTWLNAYFEMVAAMTTTGGSVFAADALSPTLHLWRALVAWHGGLVIWVAAVSILAPLNLGGYEVAEGNAFRLSEREAGQRRIAPDLRVARAAATLGPVYLGLTLLLWALLVVLGEGATRGLILAMSTLSTSGITGAAGPPGSGAGHPGEVAIAAFLVFAISRQTFSTDINRDRRRDLAHDRELGIAAAIAGSITLFLFARHWIGAIEVGEGAETGNALAALWGTAFTVLSFLTTTGFESASWGAARAWSGFDTPSVLLLGLTMFGGGVATTAGGVKLLRIFILYAHGRREMSLLVHPHSVGGSRGLLRRIPPGGMEAAWVFFMLFALTLAGVTLALTLAGLDFAPALTLATAALTTTGPLATVASDGQAAFATLADAAKVIAMIAMVIGRLEVLAVFAMLAPAFWRD